MREEAAQLSLGNATQTFTAGRMFYGTSRSPLEKCLAGDVLPPLPPALNKQCRLADPEDRRIR